jgi:hypothetical protein
VLDLDKMRKQIGELSEQAAAPDLWDDQANAQRVTSRLAALQSELDRVSGLRRRIDDLGVLAELAEAEDDADTRTEVDKELADLYQVDVGSLNRAAKRNQERFPESFRFQLTTEEHEALRFQFGILNESLGKGRHRKYLPTAYTEQGVAMLSAVLRSQTAVQVSIRIIEAFVAMRRFLHANAGMFQRLDGIEHRQIAFEAETDRRFEQVFDALEKPETLPRQGVFYDGQVYDAHAFASRLVRGARKSIIIIDNYMDETVLTLLSKRTPGIPVTLFTRKVTPQLLLDVEKHNAQYPTVQIRHLRDAHDRFLILDDKTVYHLGASLKDLGKKWFAFSRFDHAAAGMLERLRLERR